jgi:hypothetical protein
MTREAVEKEVGQIQLMTPRERLLSLHSDYCDAARAVMEAKNQDYGADSDPFRNFRSFGQLGILVRLSDKMSRLRTFVERGDLKVSDESISDTALDAINYVVLLLAMIEFGDECNGGRTTI